MVDRQTLYAAYVLSHARIGVPDEVDPKLAAASALGVQDARAEDGICGIDDLVERLSLLGANPIDGKTETSGIAPVHAELIRVRSKADELAAVIGDTRAILEAEAGETTPAAARRVVASVSDVGPTDRDERERTEAEARLRRLILADGQTDTGNRWLAESAGDEIVRLRDLNAGAFDSKHQMQAMIGRVWDAISPDIKVARRDLVEQAGILYREHERAKEALGQARAKAEELSAHNVAVLQDHSALVRELANRVRELPIDGASSAPAADDHPHRPDVVDARCAATARALLAMGVAADRAERAVRVAEEVGTWAAETAHSACLRWMKTNRGLMLSGNAGLWDLHLRDYVRAALGPAVKPAAPGLSAEDAETLRVSTLWSEIRPGTWQRQGRGILWHVDSAADLVGLRAAARQIRAKAPAAAHGAPGKATGEATAAGSGSVAEEQGAAQGLPKPERVEVGQRWRTPAGLDVRVTAVDQDGDVCLAGDGVRYGGMKAAKMLESDSWTFLGGPSPQDPSPKRDGARRAVEVLTRAAPTDSECRRVEADGGRMVACIRHPKHDERCAIASDLAAETGDYPTETTEPTARDAVAGMLLRHGYYDAADDIAGGESPGVVAVEMAGAVSGHACIAALEALARGAIDVHIFERRARFQGIRNALCALDGETLERAAYRVKGERDEARAEAATLRDENTDLRERLDINRKDVSTLREQIAKAAPSGMRIEKRADGEWLVGAGDVSDCDAVPPGSYPDDWRMVCTHHFDGQHVSCGKREPGAFKIDARWPIAASAREDESSRIAIPGADDLHLFSAMPGARIDLIVPKALEPHDVMRTVAELLGIPAEDPNGPLIPCGPDGHDTRTPQQIVDAAAELESTMPALASRTRAYARGIREGERRAKVKAEELLASWEAIRAACLRLRSSVKHGTTTWARRDSSALIRRSCMLELSDAFDVPLPATPTDPGKPPTGEPAPEYESGTPRADVNAFAKSVISEAKQRGVINNDQTHEIAGIIDRRLWPENYRGASVASGRPSAEERAAFEERAAGPFIPHAEVMAGVCERAHADGIVDGLNRALGFVREFCGGEAHPWIERKVADAVASAARTLVPADRQPHGAARAALLELATGWEAAGASHEDLGDNDAARGFNVAAADLRRLLDEPAREAPGDASAPSPEKASPVAPDRETLGRAVHEVWAGRGSGTAKWDDRTEHSKELLRLAGERLFSMGVRWATGEEDRPPPTCDGCGKPESTGPHFVCAVTKRAPAAAPAPPAPSGDGIDAWIGQPARALAAKWNKHAGILPNDTPEPEARNGSCAGYSERVAKTIAAIESIVREIGSKSLETFKGEPVINLDITMSVEPGADSSEVAAQLGREIHEAIAGATASDAEAEQPTGTCSCPECGRGPVRFGGRCDRCVAKLEADVKPPHNAEEAALCSYKAWLAAADAKANEPGAWAWPSWMDVLQAEKRRLDAHAQASAPHNAAQGSLQQAIDGWNLVASEGKRLEATIRDGAVAPQDAPPWAVALEREGLAHAAYRDRAAQRDGTILVAASRLVRTEGEARLILAALGFAPGAADRVLSGESAMPDAPSPLPATPSKGPAAITAPRLWVRGSDTWLIGDAEPGCHAESGPRGPERSISLACTAHLDGHHLATGGCSPGDPGRIVMHRWPIAAASPETPDPRWEPGAVWELAPCGPYGVRRYTLECMSADGSHVNLSGHRVERRADMTEANGWRFVGPAKPPQVKPGQVWRCVGIEGELEVSGVVRDAVDRVSLRRDGAHKANVVARAIDMLGLKEWTFVRGPR